MVNFLPSGFWDTICPWQTMYALLFGVEVMLVLLLVYSYFFLEVDTMGYWIWQLDIAIVGVTTLGTLGVLLKCRSR